MLHALRKPRLIDIEARVERLDGDHEVDRIQPPRNLVAQVDQAVAGMAGQSGRDQKPVHRTTLEHFALGKTAAAVTCRAGLSAVEVRPYLVRSARGISGPEQRQEGVR